MEVEIVSYTIGPHRVVSYSQRGVSRELENLKEQQK
jgi:hypothetical protein